MSKKTKNIPICAVTDVNKLNITSGYGFMFIDAETKHLCIKKTDTIIEYTNTLSGIDGWLNDDYLYSDLSGLPTIGDAILTGDITNIITGIEGFGGEENIITGISVNGTQMDPDENKNININIPTNTSFTLAGLSEKSYNSLTDKPEIPTNASFTLADLSEKSYNSLTDKPTINGTAISGEISSYITSLPSYGGGGKLYTAGNRIEIKDDNSINWVDDDYTAWEVMPHTENIPLNGLSVKLDGKNNGETIYNTQYVPRIPNTEYANQENFGVIISSTIEEFRIRTTKPADKSDVVIDWGDGAVNSLSSICTLESADIIDNKTDNKIDIIIEYTYSVSHDYYSVTEKDSGGNWKKFIIKIYGRDYFGLTRYSSGNNDQGQQNTNLMCRVFDSDLPIASHLTHLAYFCHGAYRLLYVNIPPLCKLTYFANLAGLFNFCVNLRYAYGFKRMYSPYTIECMFKQCTALTKTDFRFPNTITSAKQIFHGCKSLKADISKMFDGNGFANQKVDLSNAFYMNFTSAANTFVYPIGEDGKTTVYFDDEYLHTTEGSKNHGIVNASNKPSDLSLSLSESIDQFLWNNQTVNIKGDGFISGCADTLRSSFPVSWGGTNTSIDAELSITDEMKLDYTAFEIFAHNYEISGFELHSISGFVPKELPPIFVEDLNANLYDNTAYGNGKGEVGATLTPIPAKIKHSFRIRTYCENFINCDIIIDWGDGTFNKLSDGPDNVVELEKFAIVKNSDRRAGRRRFLFVSYI